MLSKKQMFHQVMFTTPSFMHVRFESRNHKTTTITTCILQITKFATCMGQTDSHKQNCPVINRTTGKRLHPRRNAKQTVDFQGLWWKWHSTRGKKNISLRKRNSKQNGGISQLQNQSSVLLSISTASCKCLF